MREQFADPQLYVKHNNNNKLAMILSTHVDDLKGGAPTAEAQRLFTHLEPHFGKCISQWESFTHVGIEHVSGPDGMYIHQENFKGRLKDIDEALYSNLADETLVSQEYHACYMSLLGSVAWLTLTMAVISVYRQACQRRAHAPRAIDCKRLNTLLKYVRRNGIGIWFRKVARPFRLVGVTDAAFKTQPE